MKRCDMSEEELEKVRKYFREWRRANKDRINAKAKVYNKIWRATHKEQVRKSVMDHRAKNLDAYRKYQREYHKAWRARKKAAKLLEEATYDEGHS